MKPLRVLLVVLILCVFVLGVSLGDIGPVLHKATQICLECIGIG